MIRHVAVYRWNEGTTAEQVGAVTAALDELPGRVPSIRRYTYGPDVQLGDGRWDYAVVADFDDADGYRSYEEHPDHLAVRSDVIGPLIAQRAIVQLEAAVDATS
jgi:Stress responsive A/B Barrel Domain